MSENATTTATTTSTEAAGATGGQSGTTYTPPATQAELDRIITDRISRERAKFGDYDDLKTKAAEYDKVVEANKTEAQKLADRATKAEAEAAALPAKVAESLRTHLVALGVVAKEDEVLLTASDPDALLAQVKRLSERSDTRRKNGNVVPREGNNPKSGNDSDLREFTRALFATGD